jgi:hypothetical protein
MVEEPEELVDSRPKAERVAYWYFRLNGFLQCENFIVHDAHKGSQRTDADLLAVRFPFRAERLFDNPQDIMVDDNDGLALSSDRIDVIIAEVKANQQCTLNGPWTRSDRHNVDRVLAAIGCLPRDQIKQAAEDVYRGGLHVSELGVRVRLVAVGRKRNQELSVRFPHVRQLIWTEMLEFIWGRLRRYLKQKRDVDQWDEVGKWLYHLADQHSQEKSFIAKALGAMRVNR